MPFQDPTGSMGNTTADKMDRLERMPLMQQREFDEGLVNYMVRNQYVWKKVAFIRNTYGILAFWLLVSFLISLPFINNPQGTMSWMEDHSWILILSCVVLFLQIGFYLTVLGFLFTGQNMLLLVYLKMMAIFPVNYVWASLYVASFTLVLDSALAAFNFAGICFVFLYTAVAVLGLIFYTYLMKNADFKQLYGYLVPVCTAFLIALVLHLVADADGNKLGHSVALLLSIMLGWIVVYETQLIFGTKIERGRKYPYQTTMHGMAAYEMYFDLFVNFYLGALNLFPAGEADDPLIAEAGNSSYK